MEFVSVRVITDDVERLAAFWEQVTGLPAARPAPVFAELRTPAGTIAIGAPATVGMLGDAAPAPGQNHSVIVELRVDEHPAVLGGVPVFRDPVVFEAAGGEICAEAAARTGRHALSAQDRGGETREVPAHARHALRRRTSLGRPGQR